MSDFCYIDLFAGAGGLSEGFVRAGFEPVAHVEWDKAACFTLKTRVAYYYLRKKKKLDQYYAYLKGEITRDKLYSLVPEAELNSVINAKIGDDNKKVFSAIDACLQGKKLDLIIGGPPCQAYSIVGRAPLKNKEKDERKQLYIHYGRFLKRYKPKMFVFENVPGMLTASGGIYYKNLQKYYKSLGYSVEAQLLDAWDYNVVQRRARVIIVGWRKDLNLSYPNIRKLNNAYLRDDIFSDLPAVMPGENQRTHKYSAGINEYLKKTSLRNGVDFVSQHWTRPHNKRDLDIYKLAIKLLRKGERIRNDQIPDAMRTQKNVTSFLDRFKVVDNIPHTMIAHISKDGHHFIHPDINQLRSISVREAARIQSFPDDYFFEGTKEGSGRSSAFRQIGNAVPPLMAEKIAMKIKEMMAQ